MKKIIFFLLALGALAYFGFIKINGDKVKSVAKTGLNTTINVAKRANTAENRAKVKAGLTKVAQAAKETYEESQAQ